MRTIESFLELIKNDEAQVLTLKRAKQLIGVKISWMYLGYKSNDMTVQESVISEVITEFDFYKKEAMSGYTSRADYWQHSMSTRSLTKVKSNYIIVDDGGNNTYMKCHVVDSFFTEPTFTCSDADREVYFIVENS
ncbi:MAG: hypothetical protein RR183_09375 [Bacteroidales bacterium]